MNTFVHRPSSFVSDECKTQQKCRAEPQGYALHFCVDGRIVSCGAMNNSDGNNAAIGGKCHRKMAYPRRAHGVCNLFADIRTLPRQRKVREWVTYDEIICVRTPVPLPLYPM